MINLQQEYFVCCLDDRLNKQVRETVPVIWMPDTCDFKQGNSSPKCLDSGNVWNMEMTGHADKMNEGTEQMRRVQDDSNLFGLNNWTARIVII